MSMSTPYELTGRTHQKARTREAMLAATRELLAEGATVTVEKAAERAAISRTTAYRYFPNQRALVMASYPGLEAPSLLDADAPADPVARLELVTEAIGRQTLEREPELRAMLRLSLESPPANQGALPLRQGRAIGWIEDALAPLRNDMPATKLRRLVLAIRATLGIEALVWLTDIAGLSGDEAVEIMRSSARTLLQSAIADATPARQGQGGHMSTNLPDVIERYFERDADRDIDSIVSLFAEDATVIDEGEERNGTAEIRGWQTGAASKYTYTTEVTGTEALGPDRYLVTGRLTGNFPGGTADLKWDFTIAGQQITQLTIAP